MKHPQVSAKWPSYCDEVFIKSPLSFYNRCGPLVRYWCMRFEGKHNYFKDLAHRVKCFKNIAKTLATRHQHLMCYYLGTSTPGSPFCKDAMVGPGVCVCVCVRVCARMRVFACLCVATIAQYQYSLHVHVQTVVILRVHVQRITYTLQYRPKYCQHYHSRRMSSVFFLIAMRSHW